MPIESEMTKENLYCDNPDKVWVVTYGGNTFTPLLVSAKNGKRETYPELNFEANEKEFIVQFDNFTDLYACRDSGVEVNIHVTNLNRTKRIKGTISHQNF